MYKKIIHVTEAMGGGVLDFLAMLCKHQEPYFDAIEVIYIERKETPALNVLKDRFSKSIILVPISFPLEIPMRFQTFARPILFLRLYAHLLKKIATQRDFVIHAHSTIAGVLVRAIPKPLLSKTICAYSPHGYAFLKNDLGKSSVKIIKFIERSLSGKGKTICTSDSEENIGKATIKRNADISLLVNGVELSEIALKPRSYPCGKPVVGMVGRIVPQKAPWRFQEIAEKMSNTADFVWIGSNEFNQNLWLDPNLIKISPWVERDILVEKMKAIDILLFPTQYEGASLVVSLAQALGIPAIVSNVVGNKNSISDQHSGYLCDTNDEMIKRICDILQTKEIYESFSNSALIYARDSLSNKNLGRRSIKIYFDH